MRKLALLALALILTAAPLALAAPKPSSPPCFPGAYYRKVVSHPGPWTGIEVKVTLPQLEPDMTRLRPGTQRPKDNGSIYIGGHAAQQEIDCGVLWEVIREPDGSVSPVGKAYRPFWRNNQWFSAPAVPQYYYYPGDTIRMACYVVAENRLRLEVELIEPAKDRPQPVAEPTEEHPTLLAVEFQAPGFSPAPRQPQEFKRVNAIDQLGREGKGVDPSHAKLLDTLWQEAMLMRGDARVPMTPARSYDMRCPSPEFFQITPHHPAKGGERVSIYATPVDRKAANDAEALTFSCCD